MKRLGNVWNDFVSNDNAATAIVEGTRFKRSQKAVSFLLSNDSQKKGQLDAEEVKKYAQVIVDKIKKGEWQHKQPKHRRQFCKSRTKAGGKWRELYIPELEDHIVGHMAMQAAMPAFTKGMHPHCCGSVPDRGIKHVVVNVEKWMKHDLQCRYFVKLDIRHFFDNIQAKKLKQALREKIKDERLLKIFEQIIDSAPVACPIGYYTSPWLANLYIESLDWFIEQSLYKERRGKRIKYVRHYLRYVDDILLIGTSKADLEKSVRAIKKYLIENYNLEIKDNWEIKKIGKHEIKDGKWILKPGTYMCDIGGYKFCKDSTILRDDVFLETARLARKMKKQGYYKIHQCESINARIGWASHCDNIHFLKKYINSQIDVKKTRRIVSCGHTAETTKQLNLRNSKNQAAPSF